MQNIMVSEACMVWLVLCETFTFEAYSHPPFWPLLPLYFSFHTKFFSSLVSKRFLLYALRPLGGIQ